MGVLQLLAADQSTVLFDFANPTGSGNPSSLVTRLMSGIDLGTVTPSLALFGYPHAGAQLLDRKHEPIDMVVTFGASATTDDNLWAGLGTLARYLETASPGQPVVLAWNELTSVRYIDVIAALNLPQLLRGQASAGLVASRKASLEPIALRLLRQPWARRAEVTTTARTVPNNPITAGSPGSFVGRIYRDTILGDLPTPGKIKVTMDSGSAVERTLIAHIPLGTRASTVFDDYLSDTAFVNCESTNRGWTVTLANDTSSVADASGSGGNVARVSGSGSTVTDMVRRFRATRTTKLDSLRGVWRPQLRTKLGASSTWEVELVWAPTSGEGFYREGAITLDLETLGTPSTFGYTEVDLGHMHLPTDVALGGITVEIWARRLSGSGNLELDEVWFPPDEPQGTAVVPSGGSSQTWLGKSLLTPVSNPAGGTAGTVVSNDLRFNATTNNAGVGLAAGTVLPAGRYVSTFRISNGSVSSVTVATGIRNITSSSYASGLTTQSIAGGATKEFSHTFDANGTSAYQEQVDNPSTIDVIRVKEIRREYVASLTSGESVRTDPGARNAIDRLDASGNVKAYLASEGEVPAMLVPGEELVLVRCDEVALPLHGALNENVLGRVPTVSITYSPRDLI